MKTGLIAWTVVFGLATSALARAPEFPSAPLPSGPLPISMPDLTLPSPCNSGAVVVLASRTNEEASTDATTQGEAGVSSLADYKCADNPAPPPPSDSRR